MHYAIELQKKKRRWDYIVTSDEESPFNPYLHLDSTGTEYTVLETELNE